MTGRAPADVAIIGAGFGGRRAAIELLDAGISNIVLLEKDDAAAQTWRQDLTDRLRLGREVITAVFDDSADEWLLSTRSGEQMRARIVIAAHGPFHVPELPAVPGREDFGGTVIHAADAGPDFDPAGKRIALIGAGVARAMPLLTGAAHVTIFDDAPQLPETKPQRRSARIRDRLLRRRRPALALPPNAELVTDDIERITPGGVRTADGVEHIADAIVFATGFAPSDALHDEAFIAPAGVTLRSLWRHGARAYLGLAVHGLPNLFLLDGPYAAADPLRQIVDCLRLMRAVGGSRIEVRRSAQRAFMERGAQGHARAFEVTGTAAVKAELYDGPAVLTAGGTPYDVRARLTGHLDPIDGKYHWQGTVFGTPAELPAGAVALSVENRRAPGRIIEKTPWGHCVVGVGAPPFPLDDIDVDIAQAFNP